MHMEVERGVKSRMDIYAERRATMVRQQVRMRGIRDQAVLDAMRTVPREIFVPPESMDLAYADGPVHIGSGQILTPPFVAGLLLGALSAGADDTVLEIGTGSGYIAAVLGQMSRKVVTVERDAQLAAKAAERIRVLGCTNVTVYHGDGTCAWPDRILFDGILVTAGSPKVPEPLWGQVSFGGRIVIPMGPSMDHQRLISFTRGSNGRFLVRDWGRVCFLPLRSGCSLPGYRMV